MGRVRPVMGRSKSMPNERPQLVLKKWPHKPIKMSG